MRVCFACRFDGHVCRREAMNGLVYIIAFRPLMQGMFGKDLRVGGHRHLEAITRRLEAIASMFGKDLSLWTSSDPFIFYQAEVNQ